MSFSIEQIEQLKAPLSRENVKTRDQAGRKLSYIESWVAIKEANRIFGFDGWSRETIDIKCVAEHERPIGSSGAKGWGVTYTAKVRVTVAGVVREGVGAGHGIDRDMGQAHESAIKEAESDSAKRALMTFGNPFGLALYDKEQSEVEDAPKPTPTPKSEPTPTPIPTTTPADWTKKAIVRVKGFKTRKELDDFEEKYHLKIAKVRPVEPELHEQLIASMRSRHAEFTE